MSLLYHQRMSTLPYILLDMINLTTNLTVRTFGLVGGFNTCTVVAHCSTREPNYK